MATTKVNQLAKISLGLSPEADIHYSQLVDAVNTLLGYNGPIPLQDHIDLGGKQIKNLGAATEDADAISSAIAQSRYSPAVMAKNLEPNNQGQGFKGYRILSNSSQREGTSDYMDDLMSSTPNANGILPTLQTVGGGVQVNIPASTLQFASGNTVQTQARTDILSPPSSYPISSIAAVANVVTVTLSAASGLTVGQTMTVVGVTPAQFNGAYFITASSGGGTTLQYVADIGTISGSGGDVEVANVYYYAIRKRSNLLQLFGPFNGDTAQNRLQVNYDGFQILAVVSLTASGGQVSQTGGGGSPIIGSPTAGSFF